MSGQQIGSAVGFVAGFFLPGGPMVWSAIGGMIGGWISPTQVNGPRIGDGQSQSSAEGMPIPWILGTGPTPIQGQIIQRSKRREVKKTDDGKGSGTEVNTYEAHQDFCILICESSEHRNSLMKGVLFCLVDGKIVYDKRPEANFGAQNAKFLKNHTFYDGNESQMPDPTGEAIVGVDLALAYRGVFTMWARDINLSQYGDRIPVYQFVMVGAGDVTPNVIETLVVPQYSGFVNAHWPLRDSQDDYTYEGWWNGNPVAGATIAEIQANAAYNYGVYRPPINYLGYTSNLEVDSAHSYDAIRPQASAVNNESVILIYSDLLPKYFVDAAGGTFCPIIPYPGAFQSSDFFADWVGLVGFVNDNGTGTIPATYDFFANCTAMPPNGTFFPIAAGTQPLYIKVTRSRFVPDPVIGDPCLLGMPTILPDAPEFVQDCAGNVFPKPNYAIATGGNVNVLRPESTGVTALGPVLRVSDPANTQAFWESAYAASVAAGTWVAGKVYPTDYPKAQLASSVYTATSTTVDLTPETINLADAITQICLRGGLAEDDIDVSEIDQQLMGMGILQVYNATEVLNIPLQAFLSFGSEYDGQLHFHKHGADIEVVIDPQDFIEGSDETDESTRDQQIDYPRLLSVVAIDATQNYTARPQVARRTSPTVPAIGEQTLEVAVVLPPDYHAQLADIGLKVLWARAQGPRSFAVPFAEADTYLKLVPGMPFSLDGQRRIVDKLRIGDGELHIESAYDRQSAYTSDVQATPALPPEPPPSNIGGVTLFAALNMGVVRDRDDKVGLQIAVAGLLPSWPGCYLQWSFDDGASWSTAIASMTQPSTMGYLTAPLPLAPAAGDDVTNTLSVSVHGGQLNSITRLQYLNETNPFAIVRDATTGECEIGQFQFADETSTDRYDLTTLVRGALSSEPAAHPIGARFVFLDSMYFLEVPASQIGRAMLLRPVTLGTEPDNNATYQLLFDPAVSQTEWAPAYLTGAYGFGSSFSLSVTPRHRLGNDVAPIESGNFRGFRWTATDGVVTQTKDTVDPSVVFDLADFTGSVTYTASQLNRFTGPGPSVSITV